MTVTTDVSIIIPTRNCRRLLERCLTSLAQDREVAYEVIVVDQESSDGTPELASSFGATVISRPPPRFYSPPSASRNVGAAAARSPILLHLDSDMTLPVGLLSEASSLLRPPSSIGAAIIHEVDTTGAFWSRCKAFERRCYWGDTRVESARLVRSELFERVGGYDEAISSGEDFDIQRRYESTMRVEFMETCLTHDLSTLTLRSSLSKKYNYGKTARAYMDKNDVKGSEMLAVQFACFWRARGRFLREPQLGAGAIVMKVLEFAAGFVGSKKADRN